MLTYIANGKYFYLRYWWRWDYYLCLKFTIKLSNKLLSEIQAWVFLFKVTISVLRSVFSLSTSLWTDCWSNIHVRISVKIYVQETQHETYYWSNSLQLFLSLSLFQCTLRGKIPNEDGNFRMRFCEELDLLTISRTRTYLVKADPYFLSPISLLM